MSFTVSSFAADSLTVGLAQITPVWFDREQTLAKVLHQIERAAEQGCRLSRSVKPCCPAIHFGLSAPMAPASTRWCKRRSTRTTSSRR